MKKRTHNEHGPRHVTPAGRSVFYDLGFDEAEARVLEMRADLMAALREHIGKRGWTQSEAAKKAKHHSAEGLGAHERRLAGLQRGYATRVGGTPGTSAHAEIGRLTRHWH
jgi:helix-turn-helix protein